DANPEELYQIISDNPVLQRLRDEKEIRLPGGLYHELQVRMTYNSNHIEGSKLSLDQTRMIFETKTIEAGGGVLVDDVLETVHHFRAIDYVIDHAEDGLTEEFIKKLHYILKHDTSDSLLSWFAVGDYKKRPNTVGGEKTVIPAEVGSRMKKMLKEYHSLDFVNIREIVRFHAEFEKIHPFQDGNGRVGRLIALKECLHHHVVPFLIEDTKKQFYYRGLREWPEQPGYLMDTCLDGQDTFRALFKLFEIEYE
ncbi:MAG: Fic family protein, partial [Erysipelotrichales bacterium]|nr:Fic family protein [Erysipelotrichales bacterium]